MTYQRPAWIACFIIGASLVGCDPYESDRSARELEKKVDALTKKVDVLRELLAKQKPDSPSGPLVGVDGPVASAEKPALDRPCLDVLTAPYTLHQLKGKKLVLDFTCESPGKSADTCQQPLIPFLQFPQEDFASTSKKLEETTIDATGLVPGAMTGFSR